MLLYALRDKITKKYCTGFNRNKAIYRDKPDYKSIAVINYQIGVALDRKLEYFLDNTEVVCFKPIEVNSSVKLKNIRNRLEKENMVRALKYGK